MWQRMASASGNMHLRSVVSMCVMRSMEVGGSGSAWCHPRARCTGVVSLCLIASSWQHLWSWQPADVPRHSPVSRPGIHIPC
jgi:hypothetical protein